MPLALSSFISAECQQRVVFPMRVTFTRVRSADARGESERKREYDGYNWNDNDDGDGDCGLNHDDQDDVFGGDCCCF